MHAPGRGVRGARGPPARPNGRRRRKATIDGREPPLPARRQAPSLPAMSAAFRAYVAPARRRPALWRLALGALMVAALWVAALMGLGVAARVVMGPDAYGLWADRLARGDHPVAVLILLGTFAAPLAATLLAARLLHGRSPGALLGPGGRLVRDFARAVAAVLAVYAVMLLLWASVYDSAPGLDPAIWALYAAPALAVLLVQTGAEEVMFRGYLQGQLAARFRSPLAWALLPSLAFGAIHFDPSLPAANAVVNCGAAAVFGFAAADLTVRTGALGAAWGLHFANNVFALMVLSYPDDLSGLALRVTPYGAAAPIPPLDVALQMAALLAAWALVARAVRDR